MSSSSKAVIVRARGVVSVVLKTASDLRAGSALLSSARLACNAMPNRLVHLTSPDRRSTSAGLSTDGLITGCADLSAIHRTAPDSWRRVKRKLRVFRSLRPDRTLRHRGTQTGGEADPRAFPPVLSFPVLCRNAGSP